MTSSCVCSLKSARSVPPASSSPNLRRSSIGSVVCPLLVTVIVVFIFLTLAKFLTFYNGNGLFCEVDVGLSGVPDAFGVDGGLLGDVKFGKVAFEHQAGLRVES